jgi:alpha-L-fucosidase 2
VPTGGCTATYSITGDWGGGFQGEVTVRNGTTAITGWNVTWTFANGQTVTQAWGGTSTQTGSSVSVRNVAYNGTLAAGASTTFGFIGNRTTQNSIPTNVSCART